ncbi:amino acid/polyamine transporter I [Aspergillus crustosus]
MELRTPSPVASSLSTRLTEREQNDIEHSHSENPNRQQIDRYLNFITSLAFSTALLASWETTGGGLLAGLYNGGPAVIVYGLIVSIMGNMAIAMSLAELASVVDIQPLGHSIIGLMSLRRVFRGWITVFSWSALVCIAPFFIGTQIEGMIVLAYPEYEPQGWRITLLMWAVVILPIMVNIFVRQVLATIEIVAGLMHVLFLPIIVGIVVRDALRSADSFVWGTFNSGLSGWGDKGVVFSIGLLGVITPLSGVDGIIHMAEEVKNARVAIPRSMVWGTLINGLMAFGYAVGILYFMGNYAEALMTPTGYPIIEIAYQATGSKTATFLLMAAGMLPGWIAFFNGLASVTRLTWAFARDNGLPFSDFFVKVDRRVMIPLRALFLVTSWIFALSFIQTGSNMAFNAILSLNALGLYISYLFPLVFLVVKRIVDPAGVSRGAFSLGRWGLPLNVVAIVFAAYFAIFLPFPPTIPANPENMNFAGPVLGFIMFCACVVWAFRGRHRWNGPTKWRILGAERGAQ